MVQNFYQALIKKAQEEGQTKTEFIGGITDKIKESLNEIINLSEISPERYEDPMELFAKINMLSKNLLEITNEMS